MTKKLQVEFVSDCEPLNEIASRALMTQLMVTITQIGIRVDNPQNNDAIMEAENRHDK